MQIRPSGGIRRIPQFINKLKWLHDTSINYYTYKGDRLGSEAEIVDRIYLPRGFPNEYDESRVYPINIKGKKLLFSERKRVLVAGTALIQVGMCDKKHMDLCATKIGKSIIDGLGFFEVFYKPHHKETEDNLNLFHDSYKYLNTKMVLKGSYWKVISNA